MGEFLGSTVGWYLLLILRKEGMNELLIVALLSMRIISAITVMMRHLDHAFNSSQALRWGGKNRLDTKENGARLRRCKVLVRYFQSVHTLLSCFKAFFYLFTLSPRILRFKRGDSYRHYAIPV